MRRMVATGSRRRGALLTGAVVCGCMVLCAPAVRAGEAVVTAPVAVVRTAPFDVAPVLTQVHAGDKLTADDLPLGTWRRVKLPDGRVGVVHDADVKVTPGPPAAPSAALPAAPFATEASSPREVKARVAVFEVGLREAPSAAAPVLKVLAQGAELVVSGDAPEGWRRVQLPEGQSGFVAAVAVKIDEAGTPASGAPANAAPAVTVTNQETAAATGPGSLIGVMFAVMPAGTVKFDGTLQSSPITSTADTVFAVAVAPFVDVAVSPNIAFGFSPQVIFHVKADGGTGQSATEYDVRARLTARAPVSPTANVFGRLSPALSIIDLPSEDPDDSITISDPVGLLLDFSVGAEFALQPNLFFVSELGYQLGFQSATVDDRGDSTDVDLNTRYLHLGVGLAVRL